MTDKHRGFGKNVHFHPNMLVAASDWWVPHEQCELLELSEKPCLAINQHVLIGPAFVLRFGVTVFLERRSVE